MLLMTAMSPVPLTASDVGERDPAECAAEDVVSFRGGTVRLENDLFVGSDRNYTNGVAVTAVSRDIPGAFRPECLPIPVRAHARLIQAANPGFFSAPDGSDDAQNVVVKFGQSMFTPEDPQRTDLINDDRPYAGLSYAGLAWNRRSHAPGALRETLDTSEITLGVIGPVSLAEQSQNVVHDAIGSDRFLGWSHQLRNEPAFQLAYERKSREYKGADATISGFSHDLIRLYGLRVGNIETSATAGIEGRAGWNLPNDFGSYPIRPSAENRPPSAAVYRARGAKDPKVRDTLTGVHVFGTIEAKLVAWDFSLDGNLFRSSHHVTRRPWVVQAAVGASMHRIIGETGVRLSIMRVYRSREFEEQGEPQSHGSIALSVEF